jgi:hypothetical protein
MGSESAATQRVTVFSPEAGGFWIGDVLSGIDDACAQKNAQMIVVQTAVGWQASIFERVPFGDLLRIGRSLRVGSVAVTATMNPDELATLARVDDPIVTVAARTMGSWAPLSTPRISLRPTGWKSRMQVAGRGRLRSCRS